MPRAVDLVGGALGHGRSLTEALSQIATGHGQQTQSAASLLQGVWTDEVLGSGALFHGPALAAPLVGLAVWLAVRRGGAGAHAVERDAAGRFWLWAGATVLALIAVGAFVGYLQPYHLRIVFAPLAVCLGVALADVVSRGDGAVRGLGLCLTVALSAVFAHGTAGSASRVSDPGSSDLGLLERTTETIEGSTDGSPALLLGLHYGDGPTVSPSSVALNLLLGGGRGSLASGAALQDASVFLLATGPERWREDLAVGRAVPLDGVVTVRRFDDVAALRRSEVGLCPPDSAGEARGIEHANDYLNRIDPRNDINAVRTWFPACVVGER